MDYIKSLFNDKIESKDLLIKILDLQIQKAYKKCIQDLLETETINPQHENELSIALKNRDQAIENKVSLKNALAQINCNSTGGLANALNILKNLYK